MKNSPIGVFDSGLGGLTVLKEIERELPQHDFLYLGDNAHAPYGNRSFETVYAYTLEAVQWLFKKGCPLVILACNTASAKALRTIQQKDLPVLAPDRRVLGVIRPVTEIVGTLTRSQHVGILATAGTVASRSYVIEITKYFPDITVVQEPCPMWVPLVENDEFNSDGADYFVKKYIDRLLAADPRIDTIVLGCTHIPCSNTDCELSFPGSPWFPRERSWLSACGLPEPAPGNRGTLFTPGAPGFLYIRKGRPFRSAGDAVLRPGNTLPGKTLGTGPLCVCRCGRRAAG
jgi:glutamate racemase